MNGDGYSGHAFGAVVKPGDLPAVSSRPAAGTRDLTKPGPSPMSLEEAAHGVSAECRWALVLFGMLHTTPETHNAEVTSMSSPSLRQRKAEIQRHLSVCCAAELGTCEWLAPLGELEYLLREDQK